ncbi:unnamed protein product [Sympodiomycopsis kandeliae]
MSILGSSYSTTTRRNRPSPTNSAAYPHATSSHSQHSPDTSSHSHSHNQPDNPSFADNHARRLFDINRRTHLPTPLPLDVQKLYRDQVGGAGRGRFPKGNLSGSGNLSFGDFSGATLQALNDDSTFFPSSQMAENISILQACLNTNLLMRALKMFSSLRDENIARIPAADIEAIGDDGEASKAMRNKWASSSILHRHVYNAVFAAVFRRAVSETRSTDTQRWIDRAWTLFQEMETGRRRSASSPLNRFSFAHSHKHTMDPLPDESTIATMARGLIACVRGHPQITAEQAALGDLVASTWRAGLSFDKVLDECQKQAAASDDKGVLARIDARTVAHAMIAACGHSGHEMARVAVEAAEGRLQGAMAKEDLSAEIADPAAEFPELKSVEASSKGSLKLADSTENRPMNLSLLQRELSVVRQARQTIRDNEERQRLLEETALDSARVRLETSTEHLEAIGLRSAGALSNDGQLQKWMWEWSQKLETAVSKDIERIEAESTKPQEPDGSEAGSEQTKRHSFEQELLPLLQLLPASKLSLLTILEIMRLQGSGGVFGGMKTARALIAIGAAVEQEYYVDILRKNPDILAYRRKASDEVKRHGILDLKARRDAKQWLSERSHEGALPGPSDGWSPTLRARVGGFLVSHLMQVATVQKRAVDRDGEVWTEEHPALYSTYQYLQGKKIGVIKLNEVIASRLDRDPLSETLQPRHLPMLVKPCSWLKHDEGGYLVSKSSMMRFKDSAEQASYLKAASEAGNLEVVMSGLDVLGDTPWVINKKIFAVVTEVWNSGKEIADVPGLRAPDAWRDNLVRPDDYDTNVRARTLYLQEEKKARFDHAANHSLRCSVNYRLEIARAFLGERFYFPHNIDFRGRAYPIPAHLNHIGDDLCRGLLKFGDSKKLGKSGLRWLRIHLANVYGFDKANFDEREQFAIDNMADVEDAVKNPLNGSQWWLKADDPWQCLATCHELVDAMNCPEGPENFESNLPVHQDGTCNGLQHYAALGGDLAGAKQVNLASGERPSDVYTAVADLVIARVEEDYRKDYDTLGEESLSALVRGKITRKVVKQTVMTTVYGVTFIGAKAQVQKQLEDRGDIPGDKIWTAATYLAKLVLDSVGDLFSGAEKIQIWLTESARLIARSIPPERAAWLLSQDAKESASAREAPQPFSSATKSRLVKEQMTSVIWTTPLALPVVQPYRKMNKRQIATAMQTIFLKDPKVNNEVSPSKQASAFPPNFIHSLDATHMILTALECQQAGLTFAAVHDSYWTHACDVETMSELIRDCFVRLHSAEILPKLRAEFMSRYKGYKVPVVIANQYMAKNRGLFGKSKASSPSAEGSEEAAAAQEDVEAADGEAVESGEEGGSADPPKRPSNASGLPKNAVIMDATQAEEILGKDEVNQAATEASDDSTMAADADGATPKKGRGKQGNKKGSMQTRFVDLVDLLPPLPDKGSFDVNEIKTSKYFFS